MKFLLTWEWFTPNKSEFSFEIGLEICSKAMFYFVHKIKCRSNNISPQINNNNLRKLEYDFHSRLWINIIRIKFYIEHKT